MQITVDKNKLQRAHFLAAKGAFSRDTRPALQCVRLTAVNGKITLIGTDSEIFVECEISDVARIDKDGVVFLPTKIVANALGQFGPGNVTVVTAGDNSFRILQGNREITLLSAPSDSDYPTTPFVRALKATVSAEIMTKIAKRTARSVDADNSRYSLGGICTEIQGDGLYFVSTDGRRLHLQKTEIGTPHELPPFIIPAKAMQFVKAALAGIQTDQEINIFADKSSLDGAASYGHLAFKVGDCTITTAPVEGRFPRWRNIIPETSDATLDCTIDVPSLLSATRFASLGADFKTPGVSVTFRSGRIDLEGQSYNRAAAKTSLLADYKGIDKTCKIDPVYITDMLSAIGKGNIGIHAQSDQPMAITSDDGFTGVIMPLADDKKS